MYESGYREVEPQALASNAAELFAALPVLHLTLRDAAGNLGEFVQREELAQIVSLGFWRNEIGDEGVADLVQSPYLGNLRWLDLRHNEITMKGLEALCAADNMPRLRWVGLARNVVEDPSDRPGAVEDDWILEFDSTKLAKQLEERFGPKKWMHYQTPNPRYFPPDPQEFVGCSQEFVGTT